ncbi:GNAT family N-acetyltransferase [Nocardioides panaciterrulae]|uniref:RimJ/RimL family protein N-acetyltransferase n=1 Tax=Nocardioides panaciterrulae TaxID=661492 RepID=A0A7Y9E7J8_9ACTN|nr:GNAT family N-acetyltransferase [Nocardioides panaciterrulae]NYD42462.1 RimJ/RimL family protein N-acetyltransferase [Nocardioides panaciterrulae]
MRPENEQYLQRWWSGVFAIEERSLWSSVTVRPHGVLGDYPGLFVALRGEGVHVSAPADDVEDLAAHLVRAAPDLLRQDAFWAELAEERGVALIGPSTHHYLDVDPGPVPGVVVPTVEQLASLRSRAGDADWRESGFADTSRPFGLERDGVLVAASNLNAWDGLPRDVGVLVAPEARGRRLAPVVARHAASYAVTAHGLARWGARNTNLGSLATARRLGFAAYCTQLALRPA